MNAQARGTSDVGSGTDHCKSSTQGTARRRELLVCVLPEALRSYGVHIRLGATHPLVAFPSGRDLSSRLFAVYSSPAPVACPIASSPTRALLGPQCGGSRRQTALCQGRVAWAANAVWFQALGGRRGGGRALGCHHGGAGVVRGRGAADAALRVQPRAAAGGALHA
eukprot:scaffold302_cov397-Prasinococcus_capsulatus_cf.AAC.23